MKKVILSHKLLIIACLALIPIAAYLLSARFWEPGPETWRSWAAARILKETGGFPVLSLSPGYVVYLLIFGLFNHTLGFHLEYLLTHIFAYVALFLLLARLIPPFFALLLTCAWIPHLSVLEGTATVAAIGLFALYIRSRLNHSSPDNEYLPNTLLAASLCHSAYPLFLVGHLSGVFFKRLLTKASLFHFSIKLSRKSVLSLAIKTLLLTIFILTVFFQSKRWDNNHMFIDPKYTPVSVKSGLISALWGYGIFIYQEQTEPNTAMEKDWYFSKQEVWGDASSILEAYVKRPKVVLTTLKRNFRYFVQMPKHLFSEGDFANPYGPALTVLCFFLFILGISGLFRVNKLNPLGCSIAVGFTAVIATFLLTGFNRRYILVLLPVWFLIMVYSGRELWLLFASFMRDKGIFKSKSNIICPLFAFIFLGAALNKTTLSFLLHRGLPQPLATAVWLFDLAIIAGITVCFVYLFRHLHKLKPAAPNYSSIIVIVLSAFFLFFTAGYPYGWLVQAKALQSGRGLLMKKEAVSMESVYPLFKNMDPKRRILILEDIWVKAFTKVGLDNVCQVFSLPPFRDPSGQTQRFLSGLDEIWVSEAFSRPGNAYLTQIYLRYNLHVEPFLAAALKEGTWSAEEIDRFGLRYKKTKKF